MKGICEGQGSREVHASLEGMESCENKDGFVKYQTVVSMIVITFMIMKILQKAYMKFVSDV